MVNFTSACKRGWGILLPDGARQPLPVNYRSHEKVVAFCDSYIRSFGFMSKVGARAPGKRRLESRSGIRGTYPAVMIMTRKDREDLAEAFANTVAELRQQGTVQHYG